MGAKSYMSWKSFLMYGEMRKYLTIYEEAGNHIWLCTWSHMNSFIYEDNCFFFFLSVCTAQITSSKEGNFEV